MQALGEHRLGGESSLSSKLHVCRVVFGLVFLSLVRVCRPCVEKKRHAALIVSVHQNAYQGRDLDRASKTVYVVANGL